MSIFDFKEKKMTKTFKPERMRCDMCGQFISSLDVQSGDALWRMIYPDSDLTSETWEGVCKKCYKKPKK